MCNTAIGLIWSRARRNAGHSSYSKAAIRAAITQQPAGHTHHAEAAQR